MRANDALQLLANRPPSTGKKPPRYPTTTALRMGRLAVDQASKGTVRNPTHFVLAFGDGSGALTAPARRLKSF
jgi:hypothetical protein